MSSTPLRSHSAAAEPGDDGAAPSQTVRTQLRLRELILGGELKPGQRIAELLKPGDGCDL